MNFSVGTKMKYLHDCTDRAATFPVVNYGEGWFLENENSKTHIEFCPFCGQKLETVESDTILTPEEFDQLDPEKDRAERICALKHMIAFYNK